MIDEKSTMKEQYGEQLDLVLAQSQKKLTNDSAVNIKKLLVILFGTILGGTSGMFVACGETLLGVLGSILAVSIIETAIFI